MLATATMHLTTPSFRYVDRVSEESINAYQRSGTTGCAAVSRRGRRGSGVLASKPLTQPRRNGLLGYRFDQEHVGIVVWTRTAPSSEDRLSALERVANRLAARVGARRSPLLVAVDDATLWAWLPAPALALDAVTQTFAAELDDAVWVAGGRSRGGLDGFRLTHRQALQAQVVASAARLPTRRAWSCRRTSAQSHSCVMTWMPTAVWVRTTLGELALDDEPHARLRETLWLFLSTGCSFTAAAQQLILHKNTVQYRVHKAEQALGRSIKDGRLDLELALLVCRGLGSTVLLPTQTPEP